jgi:hypothetical protein
LHYFARVFNGSGLLAVTGRDTDATWWTLGKLCRELGWSRQRLLYELQNGRVRYRTIPEGHVIDDWLDPYLRPYLNIEASEISIPSGVVVGAINDAVAVITGKPRPPKRRSALEGMTVGIEVLPPGAPADAEVSPPADTPKTVNASAQWAYTTACRLRDENKIPKGVRKADLARFLATESKTAATAGELRHSLEASYLENVLSAWGIWPLSSLK